MNVSNFGIHSIKNRNLHSKLSIIPSIRKFWFFGFGFGGFKTLYIFFGTNKNNVKKYMGSNLVPVYIHALSNIHQSEKQIGTRVIDKCQELNLALLYRVGLLLKKNELFTLNKNEKKAPPFKIVSIPILGTCGCRIIGFCIGC